jgi:hypothetical protein
LLPDKLRTPISCSSPINVSQSEVILETSKPMSGVNNEQVSSNLCARVLGSPEGERQLPARRRR